MTQRGQPIPAPRIGPALIDTGATLTSVDDSAIRALGVQPIGMVPVQGATGGAPQFVYPARLLFPTLGGLDLGLIYVLGASLAPLGLAALVGRNILMYTSLHYNGPGGVVTIAY